MLNVDKIFVTHCTKLADRKPKIKEALTEIDLESLVEWVETEPYDVKNLDDYYKFSEEIWDEKVGSLNYPSGTSKPRHITPQELSLVIKHYRAYELIVEADCRTALVLEDDVIFCKGFVNYFNSFLESTPEDWDMIFIGSGAGLRVPQDLIEPDKHA